MSVARKSKPDRTAQIRFFITPAELSRLLEPVFKKCDLKALLVTATHVCALSDLTDISSDQAGVQLIIGRPDKGRARVTRAQLEAYPGRFGHVVLNLPELSGKDLFLADLGYKSPSGEQEASRVYAEVRNAISGLAEHPVWVAGDHSETKTWELVARVGCSPEAIQWEERGGRLRQRGVKNAVFSAVPPGPHLHLKDPTPTSHPNPDRPGGGPPLSGVTVGVPPWRAGASGPPPVGPPTDPVVVVPGRERAARTGSPPGGPPTSGA